MSNEANQEQVLTEKTGKKILLALIVIAVLLIGEAVGTIGYNLFTGTLF